MKVVAFNGSPRADGNTYQMLKTICDELEAEGVETRIVQVGGKVIRGCTACGVCRERKDGRCVITSDEMNDWIELMRGADGILIGSPTYFANVNAETKALIDRAGYVTRGCGNQLAGKVGAGVTAVRRGGMLPTFDAINHLFAVSSMYIVGSTYWNHGVGRDKGDVLNDEEGMNNMHDLGQRMAFLLKKLAE